MTPLNLLSFVWKRDSADLLFILYLLIIIALFLMWLRHLFWYSVFYVLSSFHRIQLWPHGLACQATLPMGVSRQERWSGLPFPPPGDLPKPGLRPASLASPVLPGEFLTTSATNVIQAPQRSKRCFLVSLDFASIFIEFFFISSH